MRSVLFLSLAVLTQASRQESITDVDVESEDAGTGATDETATAIASVDSDLATLTMTKDETNANHEEVMSSLAKEVASHTAAIENKTKDLAALIKTDETKANHEQLMGSLATEIESHTAAIENNTKVLPLSLYHSKRGCERKYEYRLIFDSYYTSNCVEGTAGFFMPGSSTTNSDGHWRGGLANQRRSTFEDGKWRPEDNDGVWRNGNIGRRVRLVPLCRCEGGPRVQFSTSGCKLGGTCQFARGTTCITEAFLDRWPGTVEWYEKGREVYEKGKLLVDRADKLKLVASCEDGYECKQPQWNPRTQPEWTRLFGGDEHSEPGICQKKLA